MDDRGPVIRRAGGPPSQQTIILWAVAVGDLIMCGFLIYLFDDFGFFEEVWGWPVLAGIVLLAAGQFFVLRRVLMRAARDKQSDSEE